ncbi:hypothetical protein [Microbacterium trichothecenolyticum]|uniref:Uncharacterized protein n=1 Tax=Microbacterium trichothecenolyticum TaxID=69370 RepID=A0ABU0TZI2_MICTR|nr:hypothetical protein [Microbacterium trichothecenolyticum]MDQ1124920.1 hypothetical protein [Microbacterium trichothecenolyticum]
MLLASHLSNLSGTGGTVTPWGDEQLVKSTVNAIMAAPAIFFAE